jgi:glycosyltransferase involved in cell wall biosynthesis
MKILYSTGRYSPLNHDDGSGTDYSLYHSLLDQGAQIEFVGPFDDTPTFIERGYRKFHRLFTDKRPAKYSMAMLRRGSKALSDAIREVQPDVVFSKNVAPLVYLKTDVPIVYMLDSAVTAFNRQWPTFSRFENWRMYHWEKQVVAKARRIITRSEWTADVLVKEYGYPRENIEIVYNSCSLPARLVPEKIVFSKPDFSVLKLMLVGRVYHLKGIDIAIQIVRLLNEQGVPTKLRIVGLSGEDTENVQFMGSFKKTVESELQEYANQYKWPHFLLHPARYDAAPIVTTEAAAFGVPSITNNIGGIGSTVKDGVSGVVLPTLSSAEEYVKVFRHYIEHPEEYQALRRSTRERYEQELNWVSAGKHIMQVLQMVVDSEKGS